jgi:peptidoglycan hydrolase-like protein with peptidoglycan-binding domain
MARLLFGRGACGALVTDLQRGLVAKGCDPKGTDGVYGGDTMAAVRQFQGKLSLPPTGTVSDDLWTAITGAAPPDIEARCLQLTASFEGHGYTLAQGNWDKAWVTWGIIGFTLAAGEIQAIVNHIRLVAPQCVTNAFGADAADFLAMIDGTAAEQEAWANAVSSGSRVIEPWRTYFQWFGSFPEVQAEQRARAHDKYFVPAVQTAKALALKSELGVALCFDIHVQNGGVKAPVQNVVQAIPLGQPELVRREALANGAADSSKPEFREDVRSRKLAIARGEGDVHGGHVVLANWGLADYLAL